MSLKDTIRKLQGTATTFSGQNGRDTVFPNEGYLKKKLFGRLLPRVLLQFNYHDVMFNPSKQM